MSESWWKLDSRLHASTHLSGCSYITVSWWRWPLTLTVSQSSLEWLSNGQTCIVFLLDHDDSRPPVRVSLDRKLFLRHSCFLIIYILPVQYNLLGLFPIPGLNWTCGWTQVDASQMSASSALAKKRHILKAYRGQTTLQTVDSSAGQECARRQTNTTSFRLQQKRRGFLSSSSPLVVYNGMKRRGHVFQSHKKQRCVWRRARPSCV